MKLTYEDHTGVCGENGDSLPTSGYEGTAFKAAYSENGVELGLDVFLEIILDSVSESAKMVCRFTSHDYV